MITFYAGTSPNVQKIYLALEEMGLPYQAEPVDVFGGGQFSDAFKKINPLAKVPAITDSDGPGGKPITLFEFRRHPALSRRQDRQVPVEGRGGPRAHDRMDDGADDRHRPDVWTICPFRALRP